jgi:hypothetical protein
MTGALAARLRSSPTRPRPHMKKEEGKMNDNIINITTPRAAVRSEINNRDRLRELGFTEDEYGQWHATNCSVTLYSVFGEWELDIKLLNGSAVGCDVPIQALSGRTAEEISECLAASLHGFDQI